MSAVFSGCGKYRYELTRIWSPPNDKGLVLWVMLNPSTADATNDDPTIKRCIAFSKLWGYAGLLVGNAYAYRATNPREMLVQRDPVGEHNFEHLYNMTVRSSMIIAAWGNNISHHHNLDVIKRLRSWSDVYCLGHTKAGLPKHPLYLRADTKPELFAHK